MAAPDRPGVTATGSLWEAHVDAAFVREVRTFVSSKVAPVADRIDCDDIYPVDIVKDMAAHGWTALCLPTEYGGGGRSYGYATALCEELGYGSAAVAISVITIFQAQTIINLFGSESLKRRYLPLFGRGLIASYALTEASHGSDIRHLDTKARLVQGEWVLDGEKSFITSGSAARVPCHPR